MCLEIFTLFAKWMSVSSTCKCRDVPPPWCVVCVSVHVDPSRADIYPLGEPTPQWRRSPESVPSRQLEFVPHSSLCPAVELTFESFLMLFYSFLICHSLLWAVALFFPPRHLENCALPEWDPSGSSFETVWLLLPSDSAWFGDCLNCLITLGW